MHDKGDSGRHGGDAGMSSLADGRVLPKSDPVFAALGDLDELAAALGLCRAAGIADPELRAVQETLLGLGSLVAGAARVQVADPLPALETFAAQLAERVEPLSGFVLPGATPAAAAVDFARTVCRRAERSLVAVMRQEEGERLAPACCYCNRLSTVLFLLARSLEAPPV